MALPLLSKPATATETPTSDRPATEPARVAFREPVVSDPHVDAAWWPRSRDLEAELPGLLDVMRTASRDVNRVSFALESWQPVARRVTIGGRSIRLGGFTYQDPALLSLRDAGGQERVDVLVIPPDTDPGVAQAAFDAVAHSGRNERASALLATAASTVAQA